MDPDSHLICPGIGKRSVRYPFCVVWTPIPLLSWFFPIIGHTGICTSQGKVRDFAGSYFVAEDNMAFGVPTKYWHLNLDRVKNGISGWNYAVNEASLEYCGRIHNLFCDNCHSHVAMALNLMEYEGSTDWNASKVAYNIFRHGKYVTTISWLKTWLPFYILIGIFLGSFLIKKYFMSTIAS